MTTNIGFVASRKNALAKGYGLDGQDIWSFGKKRAQDRSVNAKPRNKK